MSKKNSQEMEKFKMEAASEIGVDLEKNKNNKKHDTSVGGKMIKKMVEDADSKMNKDN